MKIMYCNYDPNNKKYYCSTKTKYGSIEPVLCEFIFNYEELFIFIKNNINVYEYSLPFLVANEFEKRLGGAF